MAIAVKRGFGSGGGSLGKYRYEITLSHYLSCTIKKYYNDKLITNQSYSSQSWNANVYQDEILRYYAYNDNSTLWARLILTTDAFVDGIPKANGEVLVSYSGVTATVVFEITPYIPKKKWLYKTGDEYTDITGGWGAVQPLQSTVTKESGAIKITGGGSGNTNQRAWAITTDKVDITKAWRIGMVINNQTKYYTCRHLNGEYYIVAGWWIQGWSTNYSIQGCATDKTDNAVFSTFPYSNYQSVTDGVGVYRITEVWLEE